MKRALKILLKGLAGPVLLALLGAAFVLAYNRFDAQLTPEAQALVAPRPVPGRSGDNAYFALLGLRAPAGQDAQAAGLALDRLFFDAYGAEPMRAEPPEAAAALGGPALKVRRIAALRCNWFEADCLAQFRAQREAIERFAAEQAEPFERYQRLLSLPDYQDRPQQSLAEPAPDISLFADMDALAQARAVYASERGDMAGALAHLRRVNAGTRRVLANSSSLVNKLVFVQVLRNNLALFNALLRAQPAAVLAQEPAVLAELAQPLTPAELGLERALDGEVSLLARNFMQIESAGAMAINTEAGASGLQSRLMARLSDGLYQRRATVNLMTRPRPFFSLESQWLRQQRGLGEQSANPHTAWPSGSFWRDYVDNPVGRILLAIATPNFGGYTDRLLDLDGYQRLTALHLQIRRGGLADAALPAFLEAQAPRHGDPYLGRAMGWEAATRSLVFQGHGRASSSGPADGKFTIALAPRSD